MLHLMRMRSVELAFMLFGIPLVLWGVLGNPLSSDLVVLRGRAEGVRESRHVGGDSLEFHVQGSKVLALNDSRRIRTIRQLLPAANDVEVQVWPGAAGPDRDYRGGEVVGIKLDGETLLTFGDWWVGHLWQPLLRLALGAVCLWYGIFSSLKKPPLRVTSGGAVVPEADMQPIPQRVVGRMIIATLAFSLTVYAIVFHEWK